MNNKSMRAGAPPAKAGKAPAPLPEAVKEQDAEREARGIEALERELARTEAALAALQTEHEELEAARALLIRSLHRLEARLVPGASQQRARPLARSRCACRVCYASACEPCNLCARALADPCDGRGRRRLPRSAPLRTTRVPRTAARGWQRTASA